MNQTIELRSPRGNPATLTYRDQTSDLSTLGSTWELWGKLEDEYGLGALPVMTGTAIDVGAHIGTVAFALLADNPDLRVTAIEPLSENCAVLEATALANGWVDRIDIVHAAIAKGKTAEVAYNFRGTDNLWNHRYIGGMTLGLDSDHDTETVPSVTLSQVIGDGAPFLKVDCEGCEWALLADPAIARVKRIVGEGHPFDWLPRVHAALDATHDVTVLTDFGGPGTFAAVAR